MEERHEFNNQPKPDPQKLYLSKLKAQEKSDTKIDKAIETARLKSEAMRLLETQEDSTNE